MIESRIRRVEHVTNSHLGHCWRLALKKGRDPHMAVERETRVFALICCTDPSPNQRFAAWLSEWRRRQWTAFGLDHVPSRQTLADLEAALKEFTNISRYLPPEFRDVSRYRSIDELSNLWWRMTNSSVRRRRADLKATALAGTTPIYAEGRWRLVRLLSEEAATWWGAGTRWCTASRASNSFASYAAKGPLLFLGTPGGRYQLSAGTGDFRDEADREVDPASVLAEVPSDLMASLSPFLAAAAAARKADAD